MKISIFGISILLLLGAACQQEGLNPTRCRDGKCTYAIQPGKTIEITRDSLSDSQFLEIINGTKLVFHYQYVANDKQRIADDEYTENLYFEIDPDSTRFHYTDQALADIQATLVPLCFCPQLVADIRTGTISGEQINEKTWQVEIDIQVDRYGSLEDRVISATFERE